jgi:hypothetical protein
MPSGQIQLQVQGPGNEHEATHKTLMQHGYSRYSLLESQLLHETLPCRVQNGSTWATTSTSIPRNWDLVSPHLEIAHGLPAENVVGELNIRHRVG